MKARRLFALATLPFALIAATPDTPTSPAPDHVGLLAQTWACRTAAGSEVHTKGTATPAAVDVVSDVTPVQGDRYTLHDTYAFDATQGVWHVDAAAASPLSFRGSAPPWTGSTWDVLGHGPAGVMRMRLELLPNGDIQRAFLREVPPSSGTWFVTSREHCSLGNTPPKSACLVRNTAARTIYSAAPNMQDVLPGAPRGTVQVVITLDADSNVVNARIQSSPSAYLNVAALRAARASKFQTEVLNCSPIAADYIFSVVFR